MSTMPEVGLPRPPQATTSHRVYGPSALGGGAQRFWSLTFMLARTEFKLRFFGSLLGYAWTLVRPLLFFGVTLFVFTVILEVNKGNPVPHYAQYLLESIILFTYFQEATSGAVPSLVGRENLLRKVRFPRLVVPLSVALFCFFNLCMNLIVVFIFILAAGIEPSVSWLELIPLVALLVTLSVGVGMLLSALYVRFRDVQPIWEVLAQLLYYASPILYTVQSAKDHHFFGIRSRASLSSTRSARSSRRRAMPCFTPALRPPRRSAVSRALRSAGYHRRPVCAWPVVLQPRGPTLSEKL